jgi:hypothetical protein
MGVGVDPTPKTGTGTPRWVKVAGLIALALVLLVVIVKFTGLGGTHGPGRHTPGADTAGGHAGPPPGVTHPQPR